MQTPGCVHQQHVGPACLSRLKRVESHRRRIGTVLCPHDIGAGALGPNFELRDRRGAKSIAGGNHHLLTSIGVALGQFAGGRGLASAVDTDDQYHIGFARQHTFERQNAFLAESDHRGDLFLEHPHHARRTVLQLFASKPLTQFVDDFGGRLQPHVGADQRRLDIVDRVIVQTGADRYYGGDRLRHRRPGSGEAFFYFVKKLTKHKCTSFGMVIF